jgi:uncharacterized RDD family membrane protein YckC
MPSAILSVDLPEHGRVDLPLAGIGGRMAAALVDTVLMLSVGAIVAIATLVAVGGSLFTFEIGIGVIGLVSGLLPLVGPLIFELTWRGQTPGKRLLSLRVLSRDGSPASSGQILLRNVLRLVDFLPFGYTVGVISMFISEHDQRLGDLVAGTVVIREDAAALAEVAAFQNELDVPPDLHGVPEPLLRAATLLLDPHRQLEAPVVARRRAEIAALVRKRRPDLSHESDDAIWDRLGRIGNAGT